MNFSTLAVPAVPQARLFTAPVARVLALHVGHYRTRYGDVPINESLELLATEKITDEMAATLAAGFEALVEVLKALGAPEAEH